MMNGEPYDEQAFQGNVTGNEKFATEQLAEFYNRLDSYKKGEMPGFTVEEAHEYARANRAHKKQH